MKEKIPVMPYNKGILADLYGFNSHIGFVKHIKKNYTAVFEKLDELGVNYSSRSLRRLPENIVSVFFDNSFRPLLTKRNKKIIDRL